MIFEDHGHVERLRLDPGLQIVAFAVGEFQRYLRQGLLACCDGGAGEGARDGDRHSEVDDTLDLAAARTHDAGKLLELAKNFGGLGKHDLAGGRGTYAARASVQQDDTQSVLKLPDLLTERRLRDMDFRGSARKLPAPTTFTKYRR